MANCYSLTLIICFSSMKNLHRTVFGLLVCFMILGSARAQTEVQQRVERYLYTNYNTNKALIRDSDRIVQQLEDKLDAYMLSVDPAKLELVKAQEQSARRYQEQVKKVKDPKMLRQMVEEARQKSYSQLERFLSRGLSAPEDAFECRKIIALKLAELEMVQQKQDKLMTLLKDDLKRKEFIEQVVMGEKLDEGTDLVLLTKAVDVAVERFNN